MFVCMIKCQAESSASTNTEASARMKGAVMTVCGGTEGNPSVSTPPHSLFLCLLLLLNLNAFYTYIFKLCGSTLDSAKQFALKASF